MSQIISSDSLTSPISDSSWDQPLFSPTSNIETFTLNYPHYTHPPSPPYSVGSVGSTSPQPSNRTLGMRMSPDFIPEKDQLCLPTHQVFELPYAPHTPPSPISPTSPDYPRLLSPAAPAVKRPSSPVHPSTNAMKKPRASGERISTKDFVPPDVTGLSKREARLVKNRAAAFLSRQRKREEFETMEVRVSELEQENARLQELVAAQKSASYEGKSRDLMSEIEQLRVRLAAAEQRERELSTQLSTNKRPLSVKTELSEPRMPMPTSPVRPPGFPVQLKSSSSSDKTSASLSLLVLLCALPSIFSVSTSQSAVPISGSFPLSNTAVNSAVASKMDFRTFLPRDCGWRTPGVMDLDTDHRIPRFPPRKLEFVDADANALGLCGLDITFDAEPSANGKIRVRIHNPTSVSPSPTPSSSTCFSPSPPAFNFDDIPSWSVASSPLSSASPTVPLLPAAQLDTDPFIGIGMSNQDLGFSFDPALLFNGIPMQSEVDTSRGRRRVRIALKSPPTTDGAAGEWEVELC
ncbi:hypothetical protein B0F90DRAFT_1816560 [Multifurca ochricompacta]|uniref:BZIP domain-containing protein n=1 Tax=Multifurca ochricompacta TaxID=376703 RepID=A0AAD4QPB7_9AGAM|nr:hypothetical protein B0F90DRAFT_1816560 [Multifurca ochricompacta]